MTELLRVALRSIGVVLPAAGALALMVWLGDPTAGFGFFLAMGLSLLACAVWAGTDARRAPITRVLIRWVATAVVISGGLGLESTLAPGNTPGERMAEAVSTSRFFLVPLLVAAGLGVLGGASARREAKRESDSLKSGRGDAPHRQTVDEL